MKVEPAAGDEGTGKRLARERWQVRADWIWRRICPGCTQLALPYETRREAEEGKRAICLNCAERRTPGEGKPQKRPA